jgi:hypothetical protein
MAAVKQAQGAEARHHEIDEGRSAVGGLVIARQHDRPRRERHEFPSQQKGEGVVGEYHEIHGAEKSGIKRQHPCGRPLMAAIAECVEAGDRAAEIDHHQEESAERIDTKMGADARQADRQRQRPWRPGIEETCQRRAERNQRHRERAAIDKWRGQPARPDCDRKTGEPQGSPGRTTDRWWLARLSLALLRPLSSLYRLAKR